MGKGVGEQSKTRPEQHQKQRGERGQGSLVAQRSYFGNFCEKIRSEKEKNQHESVR